LEIYMTIKDPIQLSHENIALGLVRALTLILDNPEQVILAPVSYKYATVTEFGPDLTESKVRVLSTGMAVFTRTEKDEDSIKIGEVSLDIKHDAWGVFLASIPEKEATPDEKVTEVFDPIWMTKDRARLAKLRGDLMQYQVELSEEHPALSQEQIDRNKQVVTDLQDMIDDSESKEAPLDPISFCRTMIEVLSPEMREEFFNGYCKECRETHGRCDCELLEPDLPGEEA